MTRKRIRNVPIYVWVRQDELEAIQERMASLGVQNMSAYIRKMALNGFVLHVDLAPVKELVSLLRRCSNNINQVAIQANTYGGIYPGHTIYLSPCGAVFQQEKAKQLRRDYDALWERTGEVLRQLAEITIM